jgi:hypothetical protein
MFLLWLQVSLLPRLFLLRIGGVPFGFGCLLPLRFCLPSSLKLLAPLPKLLKSLIVMAKLIPLKQKGYVRADGSTGTMYRGYLRTRRASVLVTVFGPFHGENGEFCKAAIRVRVRRMRMMYRYRRYRK